MFNISDKENQAAEAWIKKHSEEHKMHPAACGAIGGRWTYKLTPTGLGTVIIVQCICGEEENVTDFDSW